MLAPYFALLAREIPRRPELVADFFQAGETLVRPGVASTQAVLARELSAGDDEAARLFRQSITLTREVEQARVSLAACAAQRLPAATAEQIAAPHPRARNPAGEPGRHPGQTGRLPAPSERCPPRR
jgi:hypothetical protein